MIKFDPLPITQNLDNFVTLHVQGVVSSGKSIPTLLIVQIGDNPDSLKYVNLKSAYCEKHSILTRFLHIDPSVSDEEIFSQISLAFNSPEVTGGIIQLPLPRPTLYKALDLIPLDKDVDLLSSASSSRFYSGDFSRISPVLKASLCFLATTVSKDFVDFGNTSKLINIVGNTIKNKHFQILGEGNLVGKPLSFFYKTLGVSTEVILDYKKGYKLDSDVLILATDTPNLVDGSDINVGTNVIDFGSAIINGKTIGNLNRDSKLDHLGTISFSPGGMGPLVIRNLVCNLLEIVN